MPLRNVATNYTFEQQRQEINLLAADVDTLDTNKTTTARSAISVTDAGGEGSLAYDSGTGVITYTGPAALPQSLGTGDSPTFNNLTLTGYLAGPATLTIDPAAVGDNTGTVVIAGNLQVDGVTTTVNSTTMTVDDVSITLASGAANAAAADGAGIDVDGATATFYYRSTPDAWASNKKLLVNQTSEQASRANLEVTSTKDSSFPQYSYGIMATDDAAYNVNPGSGIGFGYKWNASGNYAQAGGIRMIKENTSDNDYAGAMLFYTRPMGDGPLERLRITSTGNVNIGGDYGQTGSKVSIVDVSKPIQEATLNLQSSTSTGAQDTGSVLRFYGHDGSNPRYHSSIKGAKENGTSGNYSGYLAFNTRPNGGAMAERLRITSSGDVRPGSDNAQDLGSASLRWANIYSADLQLSNEGSVNDVDGTWGQYTIQEGENDLFLLNRRNGKTYKFVLQEVQ